MSNPTLTVVHPAPLGASPAEAALAMQQQAKAAAEAVTTDLFEALSRAAAACEASQDIDAIKAGIRGEARILAPKIRQVLETMEAIRARG